MKDKKKNYITLGLIILAVILLIAVVVTLLNKKPNTNLKGTENIINSLTANSQREIDNLIKKDLEENKYNLNNAKVYIDPYGNSPLSALIAFKSDKDTEATVTIKGKNNDDLVLKYPKNTYHYLPIYGLYGEYSNEVTVKLDDGKTKTIKINTFDIETLPKATIDYIDSEVINNSEMYFITSPIEMVSYAIDSTGDIRWYVPGYYHDIIPLDNGHLLIGTDDFNSNGLNTRILEIDYLGRIYREYNIREGYLNNIFVKENGNLIVASKNSERETYSDYIIEIDSETGKIVKNWDIYEILSDIDPQLFIQNSFSDFLYNSGIEYYENTNTLLLTYWGGEFVLNLNYETGSVNWIFADPDKFSSRFDPYLLVGSNDFKYPSSMHSASLSGNTLKVLDNGYSTNRRKYNSKSLIGSYSSANTYEINGKNIVLKNSIDEDKKYFSYALGDYKAVSNDSEIVLFGRELTDLDFNRDIDINMYELNHSKLIEKNKGKTILEMTIDRATHIVEKIDLSNGSSYSFDIAKTYTTLVPTEKETITDAIIEKIESATETVEYDFGYTDGFIETNVYYMTYEEAKLILINDNKEGAMYTLKVKDQKASKEIYTDLPAGKYYVFVFENGTMYKTDKYIQIQ